MLTQYAFSILFIDKKKAKFSNDRFGLNLGKTDKTDLFPLGKTDKDMIKRKIDSYLEHFVEINFIESPNLVSVFSKATSGQGYLSSYLHDHVHPKGAATPDQL